jgi:replicative DNA helicase
MIEHPDARHQGLGSLTPADLTVPSHREILEVIRGLYEDGGSVSMLLIKNDLEARGRLGTRSETLDLIGRAEVDPEHMGDYITGLKDRTLRRSIRGVGDMIFDGVGSDRPTESLLEAVEEGVYALRNITGDDKSQGFDGAQLVALLDREDDPSATLRPFQTAMLNDNVGGYAVGDLCVVAGYTSDGKTIIGLQELIHAAQRGLKVGLFSLEMTMRQNIQRILAMMTGISPIKQMKKEYDLEAAALLEQAKQEIMGWDFRIYASASLTPMAVRAIQMRERFDLVVFDHLHRMDAGGDWGQYGRWALQFKNIAMDTECTVMLLAQLTRADATFDNHFPRPTMRQLRGSDGIGQESNFVLFIYAERNENVRTGEGRLIVAKARDGSTDWHVPMIFDERKVRWEQTL